MRRANVFILPSSITVGVFKSQFLSRYNYSSNSYIYVKNSKLIDKYFLNETRANIVVGALNLLSNKCHIESIYTRSVFDFIFSLCLKLISFGRIKLIFDFRGLISEESYLRNKSKIRKSILRTLEKFCFVFADEVYCVSENMKSYLIREFGLRDIKVIPCCISDKDINKKTKKLCYGSKTFNFIYVGGLSKWQNFEEILNIYQSLNMSNKHLIVVTPDQEKAEEIIRNYTIESYEVLSGDRDFVLKELDRSHFGFLIRDENVINSTASPIKFLEYLSRGVVPIISNEIGDYSSYFSNNVIFTSFIDNMDYKDWERAISLCDYNNISSKLNRYTWEYYYNNVE